MNAQSKLPGFELPRAIDRPRDSVMDSPSQQTNYTPTSTIGGHAGVSPRCHPSKDENMDVSDRITEREAPLPPDSQPPLRPLPPHACPEPECDRRFNRKYTLAEHMKTHTGERPHVCPVRTCAKRFSTSGNLSRHKRLHGYIEPLKCPVEGCVCAFPSNNKLEKHMQFHYGSAVKVCPVIGCGKTFSTTGNLNRHLKHQHTGLERRIKPVVMMAPPIVVSNHRSPTSSESWAPPTLLSVAPQFRMQPLTLQIPPPPQLVLPPQHQQMMQQQQQQQQSMSMWQQEQQLPPMGAPIFTPTKSCAEMFEEVWNPEMLDTLVSVLHDPNARYQSQSY